MNWFKSWEIGRKISCSRRSDRLGQLGCFIDRWLDANEFDPFLGKSFHLRVGVLVIGDDTVIVFLRFLGFSGLERDVTEGEKSDGACGRLGFSRCSEGFFRGLQLINLLEVGSKGRVCVSEGWVLGVFGDEVLDRSDRFLLLLVGPEKLGFQEQRGAAGNFAIVGFAESFVIGNGPTCRDGSSSVLSGPLLQAGHDDVTNEGEDGEDPDNEEPFLVGIKESFKGGGLLRNFTDGAWALFGFWIRFFGHNTSVERRINVWRDEKQALVT